MDEIIVNQIKYISSKRASAATGYAKDYVGQLVRQGKVDARKVGRSWYVNEGQILKHAGRNESQSTNTVGVGGKASGYSPAASKLIVHHPHQIESTLKKSWSDIKYLTDEGSILPISDKRDLDKASEISIYKATSSSLDSSAAQKIKILAHSKINTAQLSVQVRTVDGIQRQTNQDVVVLSRENAHATKYVDAEDFSRQWRYKSTLTVIMAAAIALLMPVIL